MNQEFFVWNISPSIVQIGSFELRWYGVLFALGFYLALKFMEFIYQYEKKPVSEVSPLLSIMVISTLVGARLGHCLFYEPDYYLSQPWRILMIWEGGLASHGAALGIIFGLYHYTKSRKNIPFLWLCDRIAIITSMICGFIRLGNFMNSEIIGIPAQVPWAVIFLRIDSLPRHPAQLYEAFYYFLNFIFFCFLFFKTPLKQKRGFFMGLFFLTTFVFRFFIEYLKEVQVSAEESFAFHLGQYLSIPFILFGIFMILYSLRKNQKVAGA